MSSLRANEEEPNTVKPEKSETRTAGARNNEEMAAAILHHSLRSS
jgi:hypothetical protein